MDRRLVTSKSKAGSSLKIGGSKGAALLPRLKIELWQADIGGYDVSYHGQQKRG